jgi:hypothetical protein
LLLLRSISGFCSGLIHAELISTVLAHLALIVDDIPALRTSLAALLLSLSRMIIVSRYLWKLIPAMLANSALVIDDVPALGTTLAKFPFAPLLLVFLPLLNEALAEIPDIKGHSSDP